MVESIYFLKPAWCGNHLAGLRPEIGLTARYCSHRLPGGGLSLPLSLVPQSPHRLYRSAGAAGLSAAQKIIAPIAATPSAITTGSRAATSLHLGQYQPHHLRPRSAERYPNPDLARPPRHHVRDHALQPHPRQQGRQQPEGRRQRRDDPVHVDVLLNLRLHRLHFEHVRPATGAEIRQDKRTRGERQHVTTEWNAPE